MLNVEMALEIGINACIDKLGREFVRTHREQAVAAFGEYESGVFCFVGVEEDTINKNNDAVYILDSCSVFPYRVSCYVSLDDGALSFVECVLPTK